MSVRKALAIVALVPCLALGAEWNITPGHWSWKAGVDNVDSLPGSGNLVNDVRVAGCVDAVGECSPTLWIWTSDEEWSQISGGESGAVTSVALTAPSILSVSGSPITSSGTIALSLATQAANTMLMGPTSGGAATPTFRAIGLGDMPDLTGPYPILDITVCSDGQFLGGSSGSWACGSSLAGNADTATALAANGANCSAGQAAAGVDASGNAEGCAAYLGEVTGQPIEDLASPCADGEVFATDAEGAIVCVERLADITGESITDLSDVTALSGNTSVVATTSGALTSGDCVEFDASGNLVASGGACGGGSPTFADIASGTNTTAAMVVGAGASLTTGASNFTVGVVPVGSAGTASDPILTVGSGSGVGFRLWETSGQIHLLDSAGAGYRTLNLAAAAAANSPFPWRISNTEVAVGSGMAIKFNNAAYFNTFDTWLRRSGTSALTIDSDGAGGAADLTVTGDIVADTLAGDLTFDNVASGTNTTAAMVVGAGSTLKIASTGTIDASGIDADGDGTREIAATPGTSIGFNPSDDGSAELTINSSGHLVSAGNSVAFYQSNGTTLMGRINSSGITVTPGLLGGASQGSLCDTNTSLTVPSIGVALSGDGYPCDTGIGRDSTTGGVSIIDENVSLILATVTGDDYVAIRGCKHFGAMAAAPAVTTPSECDEYTDTDDGSGNAAKCVYLDGAWAKIVGAGACS